MGKKENKGEIVLYQPNEVLKIEARLENESVWLTQEQIFIRSSMPPVEGIFYEGQIFDAYNFACDLIKCK